MIRVASFDVFDTVLTRTVGSPSAVFYLLGKQLYDKSLIRCTPETFARARMEAGYRAFKNVGGGDSETTLSQIYAELKSGLRLTTPQCERLVNLESSLEEELIRPVPHGKDLVRLSREQSQRILFTSDMYLSSEFIQKQLARHGLWVDGDTCYVSSEHGKNKQAGLFSEILRRESVPPDFVSHCGNDLNADIRSAKRNGLRVKPFLQGNLNRYEEKLDSHLWATEGLSSAMAGASRLARLTVTASDPKQEALRDVSASVIAPVLVGYVLWLLQRAQQLRLRRLYFVSRDGQILLEIARRLAPRLNITCELRYLYGSRKAWNLSALSEICEEQLYWVWDNTDHLSVKTLIERFGIEPGVIRDSLIASGFREEDWFQNLSSKERQALRQLLLSDTDIHNKILRKAASKRQVLLKYFRQEGLLDSTECGMVDVGWSGSMFYSLASILAAAGVAPLPGFYFAMSSFGPRNTRFDLPHTYFFNDHLGVGFLDIPGGNDFGIRREEICPYSGLGIMLEMFCCADHGSVVGFAEEGKRVEPILREPHNQQAIDWGFSIVRETVYSFVENLFLDSTLINPWADVRPAIAEVLRSFWVNPSPSEARAWGDFPFEDGMGSESSWNRLAESYHWTHVFKSFRTGKIHLPHRRLWFEGSMTLTAREIRVALRGVLRLRRKLSSIKRTFKGFVSGS